MAYSSCSGSSIRWVIGCLHKEDFDVAEALSMLRGPDGATHWQIILDHFQGFYKTIASSFEDWKRCLEHGLHKIRCECCSAVPPRYSRTHQWIPIWTHRWKVTSKIPYGWTKFLYHTGSSYDCRSIVELGVTAGGNSSPKGRRARFSTLVDPMNVPMLAPLFEETNHEYSKWNGEVYRIHTI